MCIYLMSTMRRSKAADKAPVGTTGCYVILKKKKILNLNLREVHALTADNEALKFLSGAFMGVF